MVMAPSKAFLIPVTACRRSVSKYTINVQLKTEPTQIFKMFQGVSHCPTCFGCENAEVLFLKIDVCSAISIESSRRDDFNYVTERRYTLNQMGIGGETKTGLPPFWFNFQTKV